MGIAKKIGKTKLWLPVTIVLLVLINWLASMYHTRIDLTDEKRFTLSNSTKTLLKKLDGEVDITVLLTGDIKSEFKKLSTSVNELLDNFKNYGGNHIQFKFELPGEGLNDSLKANVFDSLVQLGLRPTNQQVQAKEGEGKNQRQIFPGAVVKYNNKTIAVDFLQGQVQKNVFNSDDILDKQSINSAEALLEYKFASAIQKITEKEVPLVGYAYGNGEPVYGMPFVEDVFSTMARDYVIDTVNIKTIPFIPKEFSTIVFVKPVAKFTSDDKFKIDQYIMNGGRVLWLIDALYAERDSLQNGNLTAYSRDLDIGDLLFKYGVRINNDLLVDKHSDQIALEVGSIGGQTQKQLVNWPYSPLLQPASDNSIVKNMADVLGQFVNSIDTVEAENIRKTILLSSSANAYKEQTPAIIDLNSLATEASLAKFNQKNIPAAVLLEGRFHSAFANRATQAQLDTLRSYNETFLTDCINNNRMIVVSDADIVINNVSEAIGPLPMGVNKYTKIQYANREFLQNCLEYLANKNNILDSRAKDYTLRLLDLKRIEKERTTWQLINIAVPVLLVFLFAVIYQWWRKRKYTK